MRHKFTRIYESAHPPVDSPLTCMKTKLDSIAFAWYKVILIEYLFEINKGFCLTKMLGNSLIALPPVEIKKQAAT